MLKTRVATHAARRHGRERSRGIQIIIVDSMQTAVSADARTYAIMSICMFDSGMWKLSRKARRWDSCGDWRPNCRETCCMWHRFRTPASTCDNFPTFAQPRDFLSKRIHRQTAVRTSRWLDAFASSSTAVEILFFGCVLWSQALETTLCPLTRPSLPTSRLPVCSEVS
jgi:hypothetical protein